MEPSFNAKTEALVVKASLDLDGVKFECKQNTCNI